MAFSDAQKSVAGVTPGVLIAGAKHQRTMDYYGGLVFFEPQLILNHDPHAEEFRASMRIPTGVINQNRVLFHTILHLLPLRCARVLNQCDNDTRRIMANWYAAIKDKEKGDLAEDMCAELGRPGTATDYEVRIISAHLQEWHEQFIDGRLPTKRKN